MKTIDDICKSLTERPEEWRPTLYCIMHLPSRTEIWTGNGLFSYGIYSPLPEYFSFLEKLKFHVAYRKYRKRRFLHIFNSEK